MNKVKNQYKLLMESLNYNSFELLFEDILYEDINQLKEKAKSGDPNDIFKYCKRAIYSSTTEQRKKAIEMLKNNAKVNNHGQSYFLLGKMYSEGMWVPKDQKQGLTYYFQAMENGNKLAKYEAGQMFIDGRGVQKNVKFGNALMNKSIEEVEKYCKECGHSAVLTDLINGNLEKSRKEAREEQYKQIKRNKDREKQLDHDRI